MDSISFEGTKTSPPPGPSSHISYESRMMPPPSSPRLCGVSTPVKIKPGTMGEVEFSPRPVMSPCTRIKPATMVAIKAPNFQPSGSSTAISVIRSRHTSFETVSRYEYCSTLPCPWMELAFDPRCPFPKCHKSDNGNDRNVSSTASDISSTNSKGSCPVLDASSTGSKSTSQLAEPRSRKRKYDASDVSSTATASQSNSNPNFKPSKSLSKKTRFEASRERAKRFKAILDSETPANRAFGERLVAEEIELDGFERREKKARWIDEERKERLERFKLTRKRRMWKRLQRRRESAWRKRAAEEEEKITQGPLVGSEAGFRAWDAQIMEEIG